jgi:hypothetical protein
MSQRVAVTCALRAIAAQLRMMAMWEALIPVASFAHISAFKNWNGVRFVFFSCRYNHPSAFISP